MRDEKAFAEFVRTHSRSLYGTAYLLTGTPHAAEDLLQETLTALFPKWDKVVTAEKPLAYVRRALTNRFVSDTRRPSSRDVAVWELPDEPAPNDTAAMVTDRRMLWELLLTLPEKQRAALVLRYFHDLPDAEIAAALGTKDATVRSLMSRGIASMRERTMTTQDGGGRR